MNGIFITIEGLDGSGKTTQIELLSTYFESLEREIVVTREPGGTPISEKIRKLILDMDNTNMSFMTETLLYAASRAQHVEEIIKPALKDNKIVICDRFLDSSVVYQGIARGLGIDKVVEINNYALSGITPNITFYLDIKPEVGIARKKNQSLLDRIESEQLSFHNQVYEGYKKIASIYPERIKVLDATQTEEMLHIQICSMLKYLL